MNVTVEGKPTAKRKGATQLQNARTQGRKDAGEHTDELICVRMK